MKQVWRRTKDLFQPTKRPIPTFNFLDCSKSFFENYHNLPFQTEVTTSKIFGAGNGVITHGTIPKLQIVNFYPGFYYPPPPPLSIMAATGDTCIRPGDVSSIDSAYRICCGNVGGAIDSTNYDRSTTTALSYCHGDIVNHPPQGYRPNVFPIDFLWKDILQESVSWTDEGRQRVIDYATKSNAIGKGIWYIDGGTFEVIPLSAYRHMPAGIAIVSMEEIPAGSELLMDYQYEINEKTPSWYTPVKYTK